MTLDRQRGHVPCRSHVGGRLRPMLLQDGMLFYPSGRAHHSAYRVKEARRAGSEKGLGK
jgi:hypothetical protein